MIFFPIIIVDNVPPLYVNERMAQVFVDVGAWDEDPRYADGWNALDPEPEILPLNPTFTFVLPEYYTLEYVNVYTIEDHTHHWWTGIDEEETCFGTTCVAQGENWFSIRSEMDIDIIIAKVDGPCATCIPSKGPKEVE